MNDEKTKDKTKEKVYWSDLVHFTDRQREATRVADQAKFTLYGGAAGGGKSYWLRWYPIRKLILWYHHTGIKGIRFGLFCEDYPALKDRHVSKMKFEFPEWLGDLKETTDAGLSFTLKQDFGFGSLVLRNLDDPSKYFSSEFAGIAVDELTKNHKETFDFLRMRLRWPGITDVKFIAGTNPGGIGHSWVKDKWIDKKFSLEEQEKDQFMFVPARVEDNPYLDISYTRALESLPERLRKAYREGNWDVFEGQYFTEWNSDWHVVKPFKIPSSWKTLRSIDPSGREGITSCHWYAIDHDGVVWVYREHYGTGQDSDEHAKEIARLSEGETYHYTIIDSSAFDKLGLPETTAEIYIKNGVTGLVPASKNRLMGWDIMHQYLRKGPETIVVNGIERTEEIGPKIKFFDTCPHAIKTIPSLVHDELHPEDVDSDGEDHAADECRYLLQTLRQTKSPRPLSMVEMRIQQLQEKEEQLSFNDY